MTLPGIEPPVRKGKNGRGAGRRENDFYPTPPWMVDHLLDRLDLMRWGTEERPVRLLEPCVGQGHIIRTVDRRYPDASWEAWDIAPQPAFYPAETRDATNPLWWATLRDQERPDWVITNPPFSAAFDIIRLAHEHARVGVAALLRVTWLEPPKGPAKARGIWLAQHPPAWELVMERVDFDGSGQQDSATTAWFVWSKHLQPRIEIIPGRGIQEVFDMETGS